MGASASSRPVWFDEFHSCTRLTIPQTFLCDIEREHRDYLHMIPAHRITGHALERCQNAHRFIMRKVLSNMKIKDNQTILAFDAKQQRKQRFQWLMYANRLSEAHQLELLHKFGVSVWVWKASKEKTA